MRMTGAHWVLLLTTSRESFGSPRSQRAQAMYAVLEQVAARHAMPAKPRRCAISSEPARHLR
jgi:hypothetical protein